MSSLNVNQLAVLEVGLELIRIDKRLNDIAEAIHLPPDLDDMFEGQVCENVASHLYTMLHCVRHEMLRDAIDTLLAAANTTPEELRTEQRQRRNSAHGGEESGRLHEPQNGGLPKAR